MPPGPVGVRRQPGNHPGEPARRAEPAPAQTPAAASVRCAVHRIAMLPTIEWQDGAVVMIDQRKLPGVETYVKCQTAPQVAKAIKTMVIRGAPAIGVAAAMG